MKVKDFYDHLTQYFTPEQALMKLLEGSLIQYEKLKFEKGQEVHPILIITMASYDLGWGMVVQKSEEGDSEVDGLIVGTTGYITNIFKD